MKVSGLFFLEIIQRKERSFNMFSLELCKDLNTLKIRQKNPFLKFGTLNIGQSKVLTLGFPQCRLLP